MRSDTPDYEITSTVRPAHSVAMSIDMESLGDLFDVLSGLYSDQEMAVLRELSTNARDSHIEAGVTRPIEITLPSQWEPNLVIQDFGLGMSRDEIATTYSKYGASTKRDSDDYNGTLGLGSKSPLTYTPQFTFIGIKDGVKTTVSVSKSETVPVMKIMSETPTDEGNGVKIVVPAKSYHRFPEKAEQLFRFWDPETVLINGEKPERVSGLQVTDDIIVTQETGGANYIVMAGVPYPASFAHSLVGDHAIVAYVPTGNVSFVPSREALKMTEKTRKAIASILAEYEREVPNAIQDQIEEAANGREAFAALAHWRAALGVRAMSKHEYKFRGRKIPIEFAPKGEKITVSSAQSSKLSACDRKPSVYIDTVVQALCVYGYDLTSFTPSHKKKLLKYVEDNNIEGVKHFVLCNTKLPLHWLDPKRVVSWETIRTIKLPVTGGRAKDLDRIAGSYDIFECGDYNEGVPAEDIDTAGPIYYLNKTHAAHGSHSVARILNTYKRGGYTLVELTGNRIAKFARMFPRAEDYTRELDRIYKRISKKITDEERLAEVAQDSYSMKRMFRAIELDRIDDPEFVEVKRLLDLDLSGSNLKKLAEFHSIGFHGLRGKGQVSKSYEVENPLDRYPLVSSDTFSYSYRNTEEKMNHVYIYLNAVYAATQIEAEEDDDSAV